jgi:uncharacterized protein YeaO (DUF488 family)
MSYAVPQTKCRGGLLIRVKSAQEPRRPDDGYRVLVDPAWPRELPKGKAAAVDWIKELYPSRNLQDWMRRNPRKREGFRERYMLELAAKDAVLDKVRSRHVERGALTILAPAAEDPWGIYDVLLGFLKATCE